MIDIGPGAASADPDGARRRIYASVINTRQVDYQTIVAYSQPPGIVPAAPHRGEQIVLAAEIHGSNNIRHIHATCDQSRPPVDHRIVHFPCLIVVLVATLNQLAAQGLLEFRNRTFVRKDSTFRFYFSFY